MNMTFASASGDDTDAAIFFFRVISRDLNVFCVAVSGCAVCSAVSRGAFALFAETTATTADAVASFSRTLAVPLVTPSAPVDSAPPQRRRQPTADGDEDLVVPVAAPATAVDATGYVVFMRPPYQRALADVIQHYKWTRVFYAYDNSEGQFVDKSRRFAMAYRTRESDNDNGK